MRRSTPIKRPYYSSLVLYALAYINTIVHLCSALLRVQQMIINIKLKKNYEKNCFLQRQKCPKCGYNN